MNYTGKRVKDILSEYEGQRVVFRFYVVGTHKTRWHTLGAYDIRNGRIYTVEEPSRSVSALEDLPFDCADENNPQILWVRVNNLWLSKNPKYKTSHKMPTVKSLRSEVGL